MRTDVDAPRPAETAPAGTFLDWLQDQERDLLNRIDALRVRAAALADYDTLRARLRWDDDRRLDAEELGSRLRRRPAVTRARLARSKHGARWLLARWEALSATLDAGDDWDEARQALAFDLLGVDPALRRGTPWASAGLPDARALADREIDALDRAIAETLDPLDEYEQVAARTGHPVHLSPAARALNREEAAFWRRLLAVREEIRREQEARPAPDAPVPALPPPPARPEPAPPRPAAPPPIPAPAPPRPVAAASLAPVGNRRARRAALRQQRPSGR